MKKRSKLIFSMALFIAHGSGDVLAQLQRAVASLPTKDALVFTVDGRELRGKVVSSMVMNGQLKTFSIKDSAGTKHSFKAADVFEVRAQMTGLEKLAVVTEMYGSDMSSGVTRTGHREYSVDVNTVVANVQTIKNAIKDDIWKKDLTMYYQVEMKPGKFSLMQILNPGTNTVISVFPAPNTKGTDEQFYYAVKGKQVTKVLAKDYAKKTYGLIFGDCDAYISKNPVEKKLSVEDFPRHVANYNENCTLE